MLTSPMLDTNTVGEETQIQGWVSPHKKKQKHTHTHNSKHVVCIILFRSLVSSLAAFVGKLKRLQMLGYGYYD